MADSPQTWHHGLVAAWWAEFNDDFRPHEIPYFRSFVERGQPALDAGCGTGRLLIPFVRAGLDIDGTDVSADMVEACRRKAAAEGLTPALYVQPLHAPPPRRRYRTIYVCGAFGLGSTRESDAMALARFHEHLEPGGTLLVDMEVPYADPRQWPYWLAERRAQLPEVEVAELPHRRRRAADGAEYALTSRILDLDPLAQRVRLEMHARRWRDGVMEAEERHTLDIGLYFVPEMLLMLERAGFGDVVVHGEHERRPATSADGFVVFVATK